MASHVLSDRYNPYTVQPSITTAPLWDDGRADRAWRLTLAAAGSAERLTDIDERAAFALRDTGPAGFARPPHVSQVGSA